MDHSIPYLNNKVAEKLSGINTDKIKINEILDKNELIKKLMNGPTSMKKLVPM